MNAIDFQSLVLKNLGLDADSPKPAVRKSLHEASHRSARSKRRHLFLHR